MDMCETLILDAMAPEAHQNNHSSVRELSGLTFDSLSGYTEDHKTVKIGGGRLLRQYGACSFYSQLPLLCLRAFGSNSQLVHCLISSVVTRATAFLSKTT